MELGEKTPQKALGYVQKTITQSLSHSLTTELSQVRIKKEYKYICEAYRLALTYFICLFFALSMFCVLCFFYLCKVITSELTMALSDMVSGMLSDTLSATVPNRLVRQIKRALVPSTGTSVSYVSSVVVLRLLPLYLTSSLESVLTKTLTRALTHTLGSTLTHTLSKGGKGARGEAGRRQEAEREYYLYHDTSYYSDYYADYYTGNPNPRPSSDGEYVYQANAKETISEKNKKKWKKGM